MKNQESELDMYLIKKIKVIFSTKKIFSFFLILIYFRKITGSFNLMLLQLSVLNYKKKSGKRSYFEKASDGQTRGGNLNWKFPNAPVLTKMINVVQFPTLPYFHILEIQNDFTSQKAHKVSDDLLLGSEDQSNFCFLKRPRKNERRRKELEESLDYGILADGWFERCL